MNNEERIAKLVQNDWSTAPVPKEYRRSDYGVVATLVGQIIALSGIYVGASMSGQLTIMEALLATVIGSAVLALIGGLLSWIGTRTGVGLSMLLRESFGCIGSYIIAVLLVLVCIGFFGIQCGFFGATIHAMFPNAGFITDTTVAGIWGGILMVTTAYVGYKGVEWLSNFASPIILIMCLVAVIFAIQKVGGLAEFNALPVESTGVTVTSAAVTVIGGYAMGTCLQPDFSRYGRSPVVSTGGSVFGFLIANVFMTMAGYCVCVACNTPDVPTALIQILGFAALVLLVFAQWTTNGGNLYFGTVALSTILPKGNKHIMTLVVGAIAVIAGAMGLMDYFTSFLSILAVGISPVAGVVIADYFFIKKGRYQYGEGTKHYFCNLLALIAWVAGSVVGFAVTWGVAAINSIAVAFAVYLVLSVIFKAHPEKVCVGGVYVEDEFGAISKEQPVEKE